MKSIIDKTTGVKVGEVYGLGEGDEVTVYNDLFNIVQYFACDEMALFYIETRVCKSYALA